MEFNKNDAKIFILSGRARSGKDTVASNIKNYYKNNKVITLSYGYYIKDYAKRILQKEITEENKPREFLQQLGTNLIRYKIDETFFIKRMIEDIDIFSYFYDKIIISDARLKSEIDLIKEKFENTITIKIDRPNFENELTKDQKNHQTETDLNNYSNYDYILTNDGNLDELKEKTESILGDVNES